MSAALKWGLITGMVYVIFSLISTMMGIQESGGAKMGLSLLINTVMMVATFFTIYMGLKEIRDTDQGGYITVGESIRKGMKIALIAGLIIGAYTILYAKLIDPDMEARMMEAAESQWDKMGMPEEQREVSRKWAGFMMNPYALAPLMLVMVAFWGLLKSLVAGLILKKDPPMIVPPPSVPPTAPPPVV